MDILVALFSPFILLGIIIISICSMAGIKPDTVLRPVFELVIELVKISLHAFVMVVRLIGSSSMHIPTYGDYNHKNNTDKSVVDPTHVRVVVLDDED